MIKRIYLLAVAGILGTALLASGGCCHMHRNHGAGSCCQKPCCEQQSQCGCAKAAGCTKCIQTQKPCNATDCPKADQKN
ncbi:hypothetical protein [Geobacter sp. DSM 9736]|uniref:hypothetical protein n=1 Tax=Geobacter sp. DSM 9736 TaxID=1277350 RepID=UPI000B61DBA8|nr:hypothetical protein [Geobacter sp. DSM 9736]SNB46548.1 hypothetical protein SAMN06269301_2016 [Geobacter sp. DSM 9736]